MPISRTKRGSKETSPMFFTVRTLIKPMVRKIAIGSLLPDSNSSNGFKGFLRRMRFDLRTANTAAASVEETIEPRSNPSKIENLRM